MANMFKLEVSIVNLVLCSHLSRTNGNQTAPSYDATTISINSFFPFIDFVFDGS